MKIYEHLFCFCFFLFFFVSICSLFYVIKLYIVKKFVFQNMRVCCKMKGEFFYNVLICLCSPVQMSVNKQGPEVSYPGLLRLFVKEIVQ